MRAVALALLLAACAGPTAGDTTTIGSTTPPAPTTTTTLPGPTIPEATIQPIDPDDPPVTGETPLAILEPILADAAERTGVAVDDLVVVRSQFVEWPDGSLGCPVEGVLYPQVITAGYWVQLDAAGDVLDYRAGTSGFFRLCESPLKSPPPVGPSPDA